MNDYLDTDQDPAYAEDFGCDSTITRVAQAIVGAAVLACAGLALMAAWGAL